MTKIVLEVPDEFRGLVETWQETLDSMKATLDRTGGGKAVDYAEIERGTSEKCRKSERETHRAILQALDIDAPTIVIGGIRYNRVGRCEAPYHTMAGSVSIERSLYRQVGTRGGQPEAKVVDPVSLRTGAVGDGWLPHTARVMSHEVQKGNLTRGRGDSAGVRTLAILTLELRNSGASSRGARSRGPPRHRRRIDRRLRGTRGSPVGERLSRSGECTDRRASRPARRPSPKGGTEKTRSAELPYGVLRNGNRS